MSIRIHQGDALAVLQTLPSQSVHCCITSPPYWGLRDYGTEGHKQAIHVYALQFDTLLIDNTAVYGAFLIEITFGAN